MLYQQVFEQAMYRSEQNIHDLLFENCINVEYLHHGDTEGRLVISKDGSAIIYLKDNLNPLKQLYVVLHELGHYFIDYKEGSYLFNSTCDADRSEFKAHLFACFIVLKNKNLNDVNIPSLLVRNGCPNKIAWNVYEYLLNNFKFPLANVVTTLTLNSDTIQAWK